MKGEKQRLNDEEMLAVLRRVSNVTRGEDPYEGPTHHRGYVYALDIKGEWPTLFLLVRRAQRSKRYRGKWYMSVQWRIWCDKKMEVWEDPLEEQEYAPAVLWSFIIDKLWRLHPQRIARDRGHDRRRRDEASHPGSQRGREDVEPS